MEYLKIALSAVFAIVVLYLAFIAIKEALKFTDAGIFNFFAVVVLVILTVPPCRPYTQKTFDYVWGRLPIVITSQEGSYKVIHFAWNRCSRKNTRIKAGDSWLINEALSLAVFVVAGIFFLVTMLFWAIYYYGILNLCGFLWKIYLFPPVLGFLGNNQQPS